MNSQEGLTIETDNVLEAGMVILQNIGLFAGGRQQNIVPPTQRANHRAIKNWLTKYRPVDREDNLSQVKGFLEAFYHLCQVEAWEKATELLLLRIHVVNQQLQGSLTDPLHLQLGRWGHYRTQIQLYESLLGHSFLDTDLVCLNGLGLAYQSLGEHRKAIEYHTQHLDLARQMVDMEAQQNGLCNLGNVYGAIDQNAEARAYYEQALDIARQIGDARGLKRLSGESYSELLSSFRPSSPQGD